MKSPNPKLWVLAMAITSGLCVSVNLAYSLVSKKLNPKETTIDMKASATKETVSSARHSHAS